MTRSKLLFALVIDVALLLALEGVARLAVWRGLVSLPPPIGIGGFDRQWQGENPPEEKRLYRADRDLIFRPRSNAQIEYPRTVQLADKPETYHIRTNERGFRAGSFSPQKAPGVYRIICMGDSSTFGFSVEAPDAYPAVLARLLEAAQPGRFEVLNLGVPGFTSRQGLELVRQEVLRYQPDLVTFGFGHNDRLWHRPLSDDMLIRLNQSAPGRMVATVRDALDHVYAYRLLKRGLGALVYQFVDTSRANFSAFPVSLEGIHDAVVEVHRLLQAQNAALVVVNNNFHFSDAPPELLKGAQDSGVPYFDTARLFDDMRRERTNQIAAQHHLPPAQSRPGMALFRVRAAKQHVLLELAAWASTSDRPKILMRDDGQGGDQVPNDEIWSVLVPAKPGDQFLYNYWEDVGGKAVKEFRESLANAAERVQTVAPDGIGNIDEFGRFYLHADTAHPDEEGHQLIAQQLLPLVLKESQRAALN